jgi:hypothetical protein
MAAVEAAADTAVAASAVGEADLAGVPADSVVAVASVLRTLEGSPHRAEASAAEALRLHR